MHSRGSGLVKFPCTVSSKVSGVRKYISLYTHTYTHTYTCTRMHTHTHTHAHTHTYTRTHIHTHTHTFREDPPCSAFSSLCDGVEFVLLTTALARAKASEEGKITSPLYQQPALHTFWSECSVRDFVSLSNGYLRNSNTHTLALIHMHTYMCICTCTHTHTHTHTNTHTHTHTHTERRPLSRSPQTADQSLAFLDGRPSSHG